MFSFTISLHNFIFLAELGGVVGVGACIFCADFVLSEI